MSAEKKDREEEKTALAVGEPEGSGDVEEALPLPHPEEVPAVVEALLFATTTPLTLKRLQALTGGVGMAELEDALTMLRERYAGMTSGLMLVEVAGGFQLATRAEVADWVLALHRHRRKNPLSPAVMETLAIVAYKQPIVRAEIEAIRGVDCGGVMRSLQDSGLVEVVGQKEVPGRPSLYGTTVQFLKAFGLRNLKELPSLADMQSVLTVQMKGSEQTVDEPGDDPAESGDEVPESPEANDEQPDIEKE